MSTNITIAIAGNPNSGKTTAFNKYTGSHQHVGNYPGITVEKKTGTVTTERYGDVDLIDLPGTYSLTAYSPEEVVARNVLADEKPGSVINIVNATVLERNLYLTVQLREMGIPTVVALNMMDEARAQGIKIDIKKLEKLLQVKAISTVARTGEGLDRCLEIAAGYAVENAGKQWEPLHISYGPDIDATLNEIIPLIEKNHLLEEKFPARWVALKCLENDSDIHRQVREVSTELADIIAEKVQKLSEHLQATLRTYPEALIAEYRYGFLSSLLKSGVVTGHEELQNRIAYSDKIDMVLTHKFLGPLILLGILYVMYFFTFTLGAYPEEWLGTAIGWLRNAFDATMNEGMLKSLVLSGIIDGVGGVLGFVPLIAIMFVMIAILEDSGYMARAAYMLDRIFRYFGLHGASVMPFIVSGGIAGGCAVPGIMAARTLRSPRERLATILTAPFMACGAKLPVFILFVGIFFKENQAGIMMLLTLSGWIAALLVAKLLRSTVIRGEATPFVMELPPYRMPTLFGVCIHTWERVWMYIKKAGTIILAISILLWAAMNFPHLPEETVAAFEQQKHSLEQELAQTPYGQLTEELSDETLSEERRQEAEQTLAALPFTQAKAQLDELNERIDEALEEGEDTTDLEKALVAATSAYSVFYEGELIDNAISIDQQMGAQALEHSIAGRVGIALEPVSRVAGFDWKTNIALIAGIAAKEVVVSTLGTAYSLGDVDPEGNDRTLVSRIASDPSWTTANATALLLFTLLYSPCFVAVVVIKQETASWGWATFSVVFNLLLAFAVAVAANQLILANM